MVIGFRAFPNGFSFVVLAGTQEKPDVVEFDRFSFPVGQSWPASLSWLRKQLSEILDRHAVKGACLKTVEPVAKRKSKERLHVEAVILEALFTLRGLKCSSRIKAQLKRDIVGFAQPARYLERVLQDQNALDELNNPKFQEAALAGIAELPSA